MKKLSLLTISILGALGTGTAATDVYSSNYSLPSMSSIPEDNAAPPAPPLPSHEAMVALVDSYIAEARAELIKCHAVKDKLAKEGNSIVIANRHIVNAEAELITLQKIRANLPK